jgi:hypothetical protein
MPALRVASIDLLPARYRDSAMRQLGMRSREPETAKRTSKYGAKRMTVDGIGFDSKRESRRYLTLKDMQANGEIKRFHRQVKFDLEGGVIYICDFQVFHLDDTVVYEDSKGVRTKEFNMKRRMVRARYGVEIVLV